MVNEGAAGGSLRLEDRLSDTTTLSRGWCRKHVPRRSVANCYEILLRLGARLTAPNAQDCSRESVTGVEIIRIGVGLVTRTRKLVELMGIEPTTS